MGLCDKSRNRYSYETRRCSDVLQGNVPAGRRTLQIIYDIHENALSIYIEMSQIGIDIIATQLKNIGFTCEPQKNKNRVTMIQNPKNYRFIIFALPRVTIIYFLYFNILIFTFILHFMLSYSISLFYFYYIFNSYFRSFTPRIVNFTEDYGEFFSRKSSLENSLTH